MVELEINNGDMETLVRRNAPAERIAAGFTFTEGPIWRDGCLLFSDIPSDRVVQWRRLPEGPEVTTYATGKSNGLAMDLEHRVLAAEHGGRRVVRLEDGGVRTVLAERYQGKRLNSPNDIVVKSDGAIYFTDPPYATAFSKPGMARPDNWWTNPIQGKELPINGVYRLDPDGSLQLVADDFALPNGLAFSPDESVLYVDDSGRRHIRALDLKQDGTMTGSRILLEMASEEPGGPDGMKVDREGNIFCTGPGGVWVCRGDGSLLGKIRLPEIPANLAWGEDGSILFLTARTSVYRLRTETRGALPG